MCLGFTTARKTLLQPLWYFEFLKLRIYHCLGRGAKDKWRYCWFLFIRWHHWNFQSSPFAFMNAHQFKRIKSPQISCRKSVTQGLEQLQHQKVGKKSILPLIQFLPQLILQVFTGGRKGNTGTWLEWKGWINGHVPLLSSQIYHLKLFFKIYFTFNISHNN